MITRDMGVTTADIWHMKDPGAGYWYILETNYDHDKAPLFLDDRRTPANKCMKKMTQQVPVKSLVQCMGESVQNYG